MVSAKLIVHPTWLQQVLRLALAPPPRKRRPGRKGDFFVDAASQRESTPGALLLAKVIAALYREVLAARQKRSEMEMINDRINGEAISYRAGYQSHRNKTPFKAKFADKHAVMGANMISLAKESQLSTRLLQAPLPAPSPAPQPVSPNEPKANAVTRAGKRISRAFAPRAGDQNMPVTDLFNHTAASATVTSSSPSSSSGGGDDSGDGGDTGDGGKVRVNGVVGSGSGDGRNGDGKGCDNANAPIPSMNRRASNARRLSISGLISRHLAPSAAKAVVEPCPSPAAKNRQMPLDAAALTHAEQPPSVVSTAAPISASNGSRGLEPTRLPAPKASGPVATNTAEAPAATAARKAKVIEEVRGTMFRLLARGGAVTEQDRIIMQRALDLWEATDCPMEDSTVAVLMHVYGAHSKRSWSGIFTHTMRRPSKDHLVRPIDQLTIERNPVNSISDSQLSV